MQRKTNPSDIKDNLDKLPDKLLETFKFKTNVELVLLNRGDELWRIVKSRGNIKSSFWMDSKALDTIFCDFFHRLRVNEMAHISGASRVSTLNEVARNRSAVKEAFQNKFNCIVQAAFRKPVYAYYGIIGPQEEDKIDKLYDGGAYQYVIPRFEQYKINNQAGNIDEYITVNYYRRLEDSSWFKRYNY